MISEKTIVPSARHDRDGGDSFVAVETERLSADENRPQHVDRVGQNHDDNHGLRVISCLTRLRRREPHLLP